MLHYVIIENNLVITKFLLDRGANLRIKNNQKKTPLSYTIKHKQFKIVGLLLKNPQ